MSSLSAIEQSVHSGAETRSFAKILSSHKTDIISGVGLLSTGLGLLTLYSYASLLGRPELFLSSISIGPHLVAWLGVFIFSVLVLCFFVCTGSLIFLFLASLFKARLQLKVYTSRFVLCCLTLTFAVLVISANIANSVWLVLLSAFVGCMVFVIIQIFFSRGGEKLLLHVLRKKFRSFKEGSPSLREKKRTKAFSNTASFIKLVVFASPVQRLLGWLGIIFIARIVLFIAKKIKNIFRLKPELVLSCVYVTGLSVLFTLCSIFVFYPSYMMYGLAMRSGENVFSASLIALVVFEYGLLPGVLYFNSKERGWARIRKIAAIWAIAIFVIFFVAKGVYGRLLYHTASAMGVRVNEAQVYLVDDKYPINLMAGKDWEAEQAGKYTKVRGLVVYQFASVVYICPPNFDGKELTYWASNAAQCLIADRSSILPFVSAAGVDSNK